jgi:thiol-disulfide isomerase/thioredoxin
MVSEDDITARGGVLSQDDAATDDATAPAGRGRAQWRLLGVVVAATLAVLGLIAFVALRPGAGTGESGYQTIGAAPADTPPLLRDRDRAEPMPLPDATLPALAGLGPADGLDLSDLRGEPAVINFWASWCAPCLREMPGLQNVADDLGITVIGVDYVDQDDEAVELARELGITYPLVRDDDGDFGRQVGLIGTPTTLFVDADGTIVRQLAAELSEKELREVIEDELL